MSREAAPALVVHNSGAFAESYELVCWDFFVLFVQTIGPVHINVGQTGPAKAKMEAGIVAVRSS
jgi:hypothetical protein